MATLKNLTWREVIEILNAIDPIQLDKTAAIHINFPSTDEVYIINSTGFIKDDADNTEFVFVSQWVPPELEAPKDEGIIYPADWPFKKD